LALYKIDLHIHTPASACYGDVSVTAEQIVESALAQGLEAIGITDHNTVAAVEEVRRVAAEHGLVVFPGVELTTSGGHILALFEVDSSLAQLEDFVSHIGIDSQGRGNGLIQVGGETVEILRKIAERAGLAIAAHIERWPSGFLETDQPRQVKMLIHADENLSGLEITISQDKDRWTGGLMRGYPRKHACIQGSDAHALHAIGRRPVYVSMEDITLKGLRKALINHEQDIFFPEELDQKGNSRVDGAPE
jgi:predicted metal-dependent phosphoesterase TrpH